jgi:tetratricopeptide (TPR) repeat protein
MNNLTTVWRKLSVFSLFFLLLLGSATVAAQQWVPPENPDPEQIRDEAEADIEQGRLDLAAEKYLWYHHNALKYRPSLAGVRLSYALGDWRDLADRYPPALQEMRLVRDRAEESVRAKSGDFDAFHDFVALNDVLKEDGRTIELFKWLDQNDRHLARDAYIVAQDALVAGSEYVLCEKYIVGRNSFDSIIEDYEETIRRFTERYKDEPDARVLEVFDMSFARTTSFIVAILVNRDRFSEAEGIAERALQLLDDETHRVQISDALEGIPPERLR